VHTCRLFYIPNLLFDWKLLKQNKHLARRQKMTQIWSECPLDPGWFPWNWWPGCVGRESGPRPTTCWNMPGPSIWNFTHAQNGCQDCRQPTHLTSSCGIWSQKQLATCHFNWRCPSRNLTWSTRPLRKAIRETDACFTGRLLDSQKHHLWLPNRRFLLRDLFVATFSTLVFTWFLRIQAKRWWNYTWEFKKLQLKKSHFS